MKKYKFYSTAKLVDLLDKNQPDDHRTQNYIRCVLMERYKKAQAVTVIGIKDDSEPYFSHGGCDCCSRLAGDVYLVSGYGKTTGHVTELGEICGQCVCVEYNGID